MATLTATTAATFYLRKISNITTKYQNHMQSTKILKVKASHFQSSLSRRQRRPQNVKGDIFVDHTCIDCDTCRWMAPEIFTRVDGMSAVTKQPSSDEERLKALQALLSCPTSSICTERPSHDILEVQKTLPIPIDELRLPGVYHCGYHSEKSYGAASYLIVRPEGNILIDSPRYTGRLAKTIKQMGGARYMFLTHQDDVADHEKWAEQLGCKRILHVEEVNVSTANVEVKLEGSGPWCLDEDVTLIHTPGHTKGSVCLFYESKRVLFTGDHLLMNEFGLSIGENYNWFSGSFYNALLYAPRYSRFDIVIAFLGENEWLKIYDTVPIQLNSVKKLLELDFEWILPGHGRRAQFRSMEEKNAVLEAFLAAKVPES